MEKFRIDKRGAGHLEVVLAFIMFISSISFAVYMFNPVSNSKSYELNAETYFDKLAKNLSTEIIRYSVIFKSGNYFEVNLGNENPDLNAAAEGYFGENIPIEKQANTVYINSNGGNFSFIRLSEDIAPNYGNLEKATPGRYIIASRISENVASEKKISQMNKSYYANYSNLKKNLGIADSLDFSFSIMLDDKLVQMDRKMTGGQAFASEKSIKILGTDGKIKFADAIVKIW